MTRSRNILVASLLCLPLLAAGCGLEGDDENAPEPRSPRADTGTTTTPAPQRPDEPLTPREDLPQPTAGVVEVNGEEKGSITADAADSFRGNVRASFDGASTALNQLCRGEIDIADSARPISFREFQLCARNGLELKTFQVASDAVVVAIKNETDVG
jgi:ABC-type phosphate transport system substrate-binding protein